MVHRVVKSSTAGTPRSGCGLTRSNRNDPAGHHLSIWSQKWRRFGAALYGGSGCALARLELQEGSEKSRRGEAARRVIRLNDCLRVSEASGEASSPRDTSTFFLETTSQDPHLTSPKTAW